MSQSAATKLVSKLRFKIHDRRKLSTPEGPKGRHNQIKKVVTALFKHERLELNYGLADESRGYAERLISDAIRYGDCHTPTMEMASYWITEPPIIHKLFKVLAPRYQNFELSYTKLWLGPSIYAGCKGQKCVLELRNNIYPNIESDKSHNKNLIHNILLEAAKKEYRIEKEKKMKSEHPASETLSRGSGSDVREFNTKESSAAPASNVDCEGESKLPKEECLKGNSYSHIENSEKSEMNISEVDVDLNKINIKEEKQSNSPSNVEKK